MTLCPSDEQFAGLLADALSTAERHTVARHVEGCPRCQEKLARLTGTPDTEAWRRAEHPARGSEVEEGMLRRLKGKPPTSAPTRLDRAERSRNTSLPTDCDQLAVPGYEILGVLGRGGMGAVYQARQLALQRTVALKVVLTELHGDPKHLARFRAEAGVIAGLQHPNIVEIYDVGEAAGRPYLVLEFVAGGSLAQHLHGTPQPVHAAARLVETLARAMHHAHERGIVHRDLKPANILLQSSLTAEGAEVRGGRENAASPLRTSAYSTVKDSIPKITDFGLAKRAEGDGEATGLHGPTVTGEFLGTPSYMAPEQAATPRLPVGPATDIYALGAILYELLTGRPPFRGETPLETVLQVLHDEPVSVTRLHPKVPLDLETICLKCLQKEPRKRYASALELAEDVRRFLQGEPIRARPVGVMERLWRWARRHPVPTGLLAAGLLAPLAALIVLSLLSARLVRSNAVESAPQQAELLDVADSEYSLIVQRVAQAGYPVNKSVPPSPGTVPLSVPATFLHDVGEQLHQTSKTGIRVRHYSDYPFPWRADGGPRDNFERGALRRLRRSKGQETVHEFSEIDGQRVVRYAEARVMQCSCVECHNTHPQSPRKDWQEGDVRGVLEIIRPLDNDEARVGEALRLALLLSGVGSSLLLAGSLLAVWAGRRRALG
jgi:serine/threonine protein kinase